MLFSSILFLLFLGLTHAAIVCMKNQTSLEWKDCPGADTCYVYGQQLAIDGPLVYRSDCTSNATCQTFLAKPDIYVKAWCCNTSYCNTPQNYSAYWDSLETNGSQGGFKGVVALGSLIAVLLALRH